MIAVVNGNKKSITFKNVKGCPVCELSEIGFINKNDFAVLLKNHCLVNKKGKWYFVLHSKIKDKEIVRDTILKYIN